MDELLLNDWHPVAASALLQPGQLHTAHLLGEEIVLWRGADGKLRAWDDRCPHRGARLSLGALRDDRVVCAYHGWQFDVEGQCRLMPAHPQDTPPKNARTLAYRVQEAYGLVWACIGEPRYDLLPFDEYGDERLRKVVCGPYPVQTSGPRIVENFLDMAHFGFVHTGILGSLDHTEVPEYDVNPYDDRLGERGMQGVIATRCFAFQPVSNLLSKDGSMVEYTYRVARPLTAILTKLPQNQEGFAEAISLHVQPLEEEKSQAWIVLAMTNSVSTDDELRAFQDRIFSQDLAILESQRPKRVPLQPGAEVPQRADKLSAAYRRMLRQLGLRYGVIA
ncbi:Phenylpropionate dioxygenase, large terminal subunit [Noviherbaspirillum humi]|uniref:Phenylpropionate dioxygenase, large terminal subunit n=1 Tax=Noviherbaspirillum humi TaxID=1688639 RepID=A0A239HY32_9BURK|nr:aromatic ring-hydroxylating dioxygenase subunit alpha [Noviherbaspirillum humi]SNS85104.1 Phenylpropionate dioxygenase, large terminal subunit [Noviherbaspirillum humi]